MNNDHENCRRANPECQNVWRQMWSAEGGTPESTELIESENYSGKGGEMNKEHTAKEVPYI